MEFNTLFVNDRPQTPVDYNTFRKTVEERRKVKEAKATWKANMILFYGDQWRKHNNYPVKLKD